MPLGRADPLPAATAAGSIRVRGPGIHNWDIVLIKDLPVRTQFRVESFNAFNQTQFATLDPAALSDAAGRPVNRRFVI
jgi:hypothetical protein